MQVVHIDLAYQPGQHARMKGAPMVTAAQPATRTLVSDGDPEKLFPVPYGMIEEFQEAPTLARIANALISSSKHGLSRLRGVSIGYLWKAKGGKKGGQPVHGKAVKPSGLTAFLTDDEFVIWIAADTCAAAAFTNYQMEALVFHQLSHIGIVESEDEDAEEKLAIIGHEVEEFHDVIRLYGDWEPSLRTAKETFQVRMAGL